MVHAATATAAPSSGATATAAKASASSSYKGYILVLLTLGYVANSADRRVLAVVQELLKVEFDLADW